MALLLQLLANGLVNGALFAMLAVGFGLVWRSIRIFHVAYGGLFVMCGYGYILLTTRLGIAVFPAVFLSALVGAVLGVLVEIGFYRFFHLKRAASGVVLIASLGLFVVMENLIAMGFGNQLQTVPREIVPAARFGPVALTRLQTIQLVAGVITVTGFWILVRSLRTFKAIWAMGDEPDLIPVLGLPLFRLRMLVFALSTAMVAVPASLITLDLGIDPQMGMSYLLVAAVAVLAGGRESYAGWVVGALALALLQSVVIWQFSSRWMDLATFSLLLVMLVFRPQGLLAGRRRMEES